MPSRLLSAGRLRTGSRRSTLSGAVDIEIGDGTVRRLGRATSWSPRTWPGRDTRHGKSGLSRGSRSSCRSRRARV